jgi:uncharacterized protein
MIIEKLFIYPVKSLAGIAVESIDMGRTGPENDRRFMLTDARGRFLTRREHRQMVQFATAVHGEDLEIFHKTFPNQKLIVSLNITGGDLMKAEIWSDQCEVRQVSLEADTFFSDMLGMQVHMVYMPESTGRAIDPGYTNGNEVTSFTDGYQILLTGTASLDDLNDKLSAVGEPIVGWERFRPNVVVRTSVPFEEDSWKEFQIGHLKFKGVKLCSRCVMTTMDEATGETSREPLRTLASYRTNNNKVNFGQNVISLQKSGSICLGNEIVLSEES